MGSGVWKSKSWKNSRTNLASWAEIVSIWMPLGDTSFENPKSYLSVISSDHSIVASLSKSGGISVLEARKFHHCGSSFWFVDPTSDWDDDSLESEGLPPLEAVWGSSQDSISNFDSCWWDFLALATIMTKCLSGSQSKTSFLSVNRLQEFGLRKQMRNSHNLLDGKYRDEI